MNLALDSALVAAGLGTLSPEGSCYPVGYVELHATSTKVGDPIEASALGAAIGAVRPAGSPLLAGSAKTNVGHLEGATWSELPTPRPAAG